MFVYAVNVSHQTRKYRDQPLQGDEQEYSTHQNYDNHLQFQGLTLQKTLIRQRKFQYVQLYELLGVDHHFQYGAQVKKHRFFQQINVRLIMLILDILYGSSVLAELLV